MNRRSWVQWLDSFSDNRKSKIENLKWVGLSIIALVLVAAVAMVEAQQATKVPRIGWLTASSLSAMTARIEAFRQGLRELGYVEGKNIVIEWRSVEGKADRLPGLAAELARLKVDASSRQVRKRPAPPRKQL
jgi:ABC-type uncharacterized transport system substrate-binding protein